MEKQILKRNDLINKILDLDIGDNVKILKGIRKSGKTTLIFTMIDELKNRDVSEENIFYFSFKQKQYSSCSNPFELEQRLKEQINNIEGKIYLFFDDVECFPDWQSVLNYFRMNSRYVVHAAVNFSKFYLLKNSTSLGARYIGYNVYPLSFKEVLDYKQEFENLKLNDEIIENEFANYVKYGGMPGLLHKNTFQKKKCLLEDIFHSVKYWDFIVDNENPNGALTIDYLNYMIERFGEEFDWDFFNECLYGRLENNEFYYYKNILERSDFVSLSNMICDSNRFEIREKYYLTDHGFYNLVDFEEITSYPRKLKNIIYIELKRRGYRVFYSQHRGGFIDFIASDCNETLFIQFDLEFLSESVIKKEIEALNSNPGINNKYIITTGDYDFQDYGIKHLNIIDFLLGDEI